MNHSKIIIITGGSFQGKSLIALALANTLEYSGVLSSDAVRNVLKVISPEKKYLGTSTYLLPVEALTRQLNDVSDVMKKVIGIYESRGENIIIEGMHFSSNFFVWAKDKGFALMTLDNELPFDERIVLKGKTRSKLRMISEPSQECEFIKVNQENAKSTAYYQYKDRIEQIHQNILKQSREQGSHIVRFREIREAIDLINKFL